MTRIALIGDSHADQDNRFDEHNRIMAWIGEDAAARGCDLFLHSGDVWERRSTSTERLAVADWVRAWTEHAPLAVIRGNHDDPNDIEWLGRLRTRHPVRASTRPELVELAGCSIACLPWPSKEALAAAVGRSLSQEEGNQVATEMLLAILRGFSDQFDEFGGPRILLGHCMMRGSRVSQAQPPLIGCDFELGPADLALANADFYALGHIHLGAGNEWDVAGAPAAFPGSPRRCNFGEPEQKGYIVIEFDGRRLVRWERIPTPCTPMVHVAGDFEGDMLRWTEAAPDVKGAEVRLRFETRAEFREAARSAAEQARRTFLDAGAVSVKLEEVLVLEKRARAPEVARATTLRDKLCAHWESVGWDPGERREGLLTKASVLEEEARDAA